MASAQVTGSVIDSPLTLIDEQGTLCYGRINSRTGNEPHVMSGKTDAGNGNLRMVRRAEAAKMLGISERTLIRWQKSGKGPECIYYSPTMVRYRIADIEQWLRDGAGNDG